MQSSRQTAYLQHFLFTRYRLSWDFCHVFLEQNQKVRYSTILFKCTKLKCLGGLKGFSALHFPLSKVDWNLFLNNLLHWSLQWSSWHRQSRQLLRVKVRCRHMIRSRFGVISWKSNLTQTQKTYQISPPRKPLKLFPPTSDHSHLFLPRYITKIDLTEGIDCSDNWFSWRVSHCSVKEKPEFSRVGLAIVQLSRNMWRVLNF